MEYCRQKVPKLNNLGSNPSGIVLNPSYSTNSPEKVSSQNDDTEVFASDAMLQGIDQLKLKVADNTLFLTTNAFKKLDHEI